MTHEIDSSLRKLYPELPPEQREEAQYHLQQYLEVIYQIYEESEQKGTSKEDAKNTHLKAEWEKRSIKDSLSR